MSSNRRRGLTYLLGVVFALGTAIPSAQAWDPFRSESRDVKRGNEHLQKGQHAEAVEAYETAASKLPKEAGVQLNRGLALLAADKPDAAREAFKLATQGNASKDVRAQAYYDLGLTFLKQADATAKADKLEEAQGQLREAVDAFKSSLRNGPKNRDAAWNLELAKRRLVEVEKKQEEKKQQEEEKKKQEEEKKKQDEQQQNPDENQNENEDQQKDDQNPQQKDGDKPKEEADKPKQEQEGKDGETKPNEPPKPDDKGQQPEPKPNEAQPQDAQPKEQEALPKPMQQALDSLANGEENLEKLRARMRAARQPRRVQKDW